MKVALNGDGFKIGLPVLITAAILIANIAITVNNKVDRDKVQACETRIVKLEEQQGATRELVNEIKVDIKAILKSQQEVLLKVTSLEAKYGNN